MNEYVPEMLVHVQCSYQKKNQMFKFLFNNLHSNRGVSWLSWTKQEKALLKLCIRYFVRLFSLLCKEKSKRENKGGQILFEKIQFIAFLVDVSSEFQ